MSPHAGERLSGEGYEPLDVLDDVEEPVPVELPSLELSQEDELVQKLLESVDKDWVEDDPEPLFPPVLDVGSKLVLSVENALEAVGSVLVLVPDRL